MKGTGIVILFLFYVTSCYVCNGEEYVYEFGTNYGIEVFRYSGNIPYITPVTSQRIIVPEGYLLTYVKVIVNGWDKPQVTYAPRTKFVTIFYNPSQVSASHYTILAKAVAVNS